MKEELKKFIDYYHKSKLSKSFDMTDEELIENYLSTENEFKIHGFYDHGVLNPEKLKELLDEKKKKLVDKMIKDFHNEVNSNLLEPLNDILRYRFYPSDELRHLLLQHREEFNTLIVPEYIKVGWDNLIMINPSWNWLAIDFYLKTEEK